MAIVIAREQASAIMTAEERGREFNPQPGVGYEAGIVDRVWYEDDGTECWCIHPFARPGAEVISRAPLRRERLVVLCARARGVHASEIVLWCD